MKYFVLLLFLVSCNAQKKTVAYSTKDNGKAPLELLLRDNYSGLKTPQILVIKEPNTLRDFYSQINKTRKPGLAIPNVDFNSETVIIYSLGEQFNAEAPSLQIQSSTSTSVNITILDSIIAEDSGAITSPFCVYKLKSNTSNLLFLK
ncbi:hypothetical protein [Cellulophaga tyrosinoxydans]|uniref:Uncharacterized protein n=1 Tax=Cellulophaga tyrosinoxydans TaxID=504486 RepID=A0A1W2A2Y8_9FLAO|nr:hypothetical protein [Cellulophaga tyrosinoxydans]SMC55010.1 hypothetical protein SAMN05660703_1759 [Cellulophaga tyrosinoxydans]